MAKADLLCDLIKHGLNGDGPGFRKAAEAVCADEYAKRHGVLARRIQNLLRVEKRPFREFPAAARSVRSGDASALVEKTPVIEMERLLLPPNVRESCLELVAEHARADVLCSYGLEPRNRVLLIGPPGNGKTSLAEALAGALGIPFLTVRYGSVVGSYLGETASRLDRLFEHVRTRSCVLFFDEFETLGKERGDIHETGEIKRVVSSLLLQLDALPSHVVVVAATNHEWMLDSAAWRRFQLRLELPRPDADDLLVWFQMFERRIGFSFGVPLSELAGTLEGKSFAEAEEFATGIYRQYVLKLPTSDMKSITRNQIALYAAQAAANAVEWAAR